MSGRKRLVAVTLICGAVGIAAGIASWYFVEGRRPYVQESSAQTPIYNSLFNTSSEADFALWIYGTRGNCPGLRTLDKAPLVIVAAKPYTGDGTIQVKELKNCFEVDVSNSRYPVMTKCADGYVTLESNRPSGDKVGTFAVTLSNGKQLKGELRAVFCATSK